jgi:protein-S-isoprenylcysteine O-methyltransferase Ste14
VRFGTRGDRYYRFIYNSIGVVTLLPVLVLLALYPGQGLYSWPSPWSYLAILIQLLGALITLVGLLQTGVWSFFGLGWLINDANHSTDQLITYGLYSWMRHPLYTGGLLMIWFMPVMTTSLLTFNLAATLYLYIGSFFEERRLLAAFGEEYARYQRRVPRLIPRPWRRLEQEID